MQPSASGLTPGETPVVMLNRLTGGGGPHLQGRSSVGGGAPRGMWRSEAVGNRSRSSGEILRERLCFLGGLYQRDDLDHL